MAPLSVSSAANTARGSLSVAIASPAAVSAFSTWKSADQRQPHGVVGAGIGELEHLREAVDRAVVEADALAAPADREQPQPALLRRRDRCVRVLVIGDDHRRAARLHEIAEQPELGGKIGFERRMIVEMVAADDW